MTRRALTVARLTLTAILIALTLFLLLKSLQDGTAGLANNGALASILLVPLTLILTLELLLSGLGIYVTPSPKAVRAALEQFILAQRLEQSAAFGTAVGENPTLTGDSWINSSFHKLGAMGAGAPYGDFDHVHDYYQNSERRLVILGRSGSGKSTLASKLIVQLLTAANPLAPTPYSVPLRIPVGTFSEEPTVRKWIENFLFTRGMPRQMAKTFVLRNYVIPVFDGLDEIGDPDAARRVLRLLNTFYSGDSLGSAVITSRQAFFEDLDAQVNTSTKVGLLPLPPSVVAQYLSDQHARAPHPQWPELIRILTSRLPASSGLASILSTPWVLTLCWVIGASGQLVIPILTREQSNGVLQARAEPEVRDKLLSRFIPATVALNDIRLRPFTPTQVERWLSLLTGPVTNAISNPLALAALPNVIGDRTDTDGVFGRTVLRIHATLSAVLVLAVVFGMVALLPKANGDGLLVLAHAVGRLNETRGLYGASVILLIISGVTMPLLAGYASSRGTVEARRLSLRGRSLARDLARVSLVGITGGGIGVLFGIVLSSSGGVAVSRHIDVLVGAIGGASGGLVVGLAVVVEGRLASTDNPGQVIKEDLAYAVIVSFVWAAAISVAEIIVGGWHFGVAVGLCCGIATFAAGRPRAFIRYYLAVIVARFKFGTPWRLNQFFSLCAETGLLRVVGVGYEFRHSEFRAWLARPRL